MNHDPLPYIGKETQVLSELHSSKKKETVYLKVLLEPKKEN